MFTKSFYSWCIENKREDLLRRWNYDLNKCTPEEIGCNSNKPWWFDCEKNSSHKPEQFVPNHFVSARGRTSCRQCSSFGQWCVDTGRIDFLEKWDETRNTTGPFSIAKSHKKKCVFKCVNHPEHRILMTPDSIVGNQIDSLSCKMCNSFGVYIDSHYGHDFLLKIWDDQNANSPYDVSKHSNKKVVFRCVKNSLHPSYNASVAAFTEGRRCPYCAHIKLCKENSLGFIDSVSKEYWSDKNELSVYDVHSNTNTVAWWKCPCGKHPDYRRSVSETRRYEYRCPKCVTESKRSIITQKTLDYLDCLNIHYTTEYGCPLIIKNPKTNMIMPFDICLDDLKLIIEVHGEQHYDLHFYKTRISHGNEDNARRMLRQRKIYDRFKKLKAISNGYSYLELPYYSFE